jgi:uncharacterized protein (TIGR01777 family)
MKVAIIGGTGLIGSRLSKDLKRGGHEPIVLSRQVEASQQDAAISSVRKWNPGDSATNLQALESVDAVVNLAGEPIDSGRWTTSRKQRIRESRILSARSVVDAVSEMETKPKILISGSAVGIYGSRGDDVLEEAEEPGSDFLASVCRESELEAGLAQEHGLRVVNVRTGIVLSSSGGALSKMLVPFKLGLGGRIGDGKQWFPWIHEDDVAGILVHCLETDSISGAVNATSPGILTNRDFSEALGKAIGRPAVLPVPIFLLKAFFGKMSSVLFSSHRTSSKKIQESGYSFLHDEIMGALNECISNGET